MTNLRTDEIVHLTKIGSDENKGISSIWDLWSTSSDPHTVFELQSCGLYEDEYTVLKGSLVLANLLILGIKV